MYNFTKLSNSNGVSEISMLDPYTQQVSNCNPDSLFYSSKDVSSVPAAGWAVVNGTTAVLYNAEF